MPAILKEIEQKLRACLPALQKKYPIEKLALFGSITRADFTPQSDVDILVEFNGDIGWEFFDLAEELEKIVGRKVDLVSGKAIKAHYLPYIKKDLIYV